VVKFPIERNKCTRISCSNDDTVNFCPFCGSEVESEDDFDDLDDSDEDEANQFS
jgi:hypothetical protein